MKSLERRFINIQKGNPYWSSHTCFAEAIKGQNFTRRIVSKYFNKLVDKDDYARKDRMEIVKYLFTLLDKTKSIAEESTF